MKPRKMPGSGMIIRSDDLLTYAGFGQKQSFPLGILNQSEQV